MRPSLSYDNIEDPDGNNYFIFRNKALGINAVLPAIFPCLEGSVEMLCLEYFSTAR